jgi:hypothetical protein
MGRNSGTIRFTWAPEASTDQFEIYYEGVRIFTTGLTAVAGSTDVSFGPGASTFISVVVTNGTGSPRWHYTIACST